MGRAVGPLYVRRLAFGLCLAGTPLVGAGCAELWLHVHEYADLPPQSTSPSPSASSELELTSHTQAQAAPQTLPAPQIVPPASHPGEQVPAGKAIPVTLDTVLRLAEQHNARVEQAREKLGASMAAASQKCLWLPDVYAGIAYYRHEGGIQNEDGTLQHSSSGALFPGMQIKTECDLREATFKRVDAERKMWQDKAEYRSVTNDTLLDAANTYIDLLTARRGEAVGRELEKLEQKLLERAETTAKEEPPARVQLEAVRTTLVNRAHTLRRLRQQGNAASAKLAYLLGLPPDACLVPVDPSLLPIDLADVNPPVCDLVAQALAHGPGVHELEGLLASIQGGIDKLSGPAGLLPTIQLNVYEGAFGAGVGGSLSFDNRLDVGVQARWNITQLLTARQQRKQAESQIRQVQLSYKDLQGKLALGVQEGRDAILSAKEEINLAGDQIRHASEAYRLSDLRLKESAQGSSINEVMQSIRGLEQAHFNHLGSIGNHNKAQVRLLLLLGAPAPHGEPAGH
jgi:outer membrane protein TolC